MPSRFVDTNGLRPARSMTYENRRRQEINRQIEQALDESDVLLASIETFHLPGKHDQSSHGKGGGAAGGSLDTSDGESIRAASQASMGEDFEALPAGQANAMRGYRMTNHGPINEGLRGGEKPDWVDQDVAHIDAAFSSHAITSSKPVVLHRGVRRRDPVVRAQPGDEFIDDGFMSTSASAELASRHSSSTGVTLSITAPPGTPMLAGTGHEQELILPRGSRYRVTDRQDVGEDESVISLEVIL